MEVTIIVTQVVHIPDEHLLDCATKVRKTWKMKSTEAVHIEDLLAAAASLGHVTLPEHYKVDDDCQFTEEELTNLAGGKKAKKRKR